jgi:hypothetical protein
MDTYLRAAERVLRRTAAPALHLTELLHEVRQETHDLSLDAGRLMAGLQGRPDVFRVLDPWRGPWRFLREPAAGTCGPRLDPWVVVVSDPAEENGAGTSPTGRLHTCVRWLARQVDPRSQRAVARWSALAISAEDTGNALRAA